MKDRAIAWMIKNPGASLHQIREGIFTDLTSKYVSNLLWELKEARLVRTEKSFNTESATQWFVDLNELVKIVNVGHFIKTGKIIGI